MQLLNKSSNLSWFMLVKMVAGENTVDMRIFRCGIMESSSGTLIWVKLLSGTRLRFYPWKNAFKTGTVISHKRCTGFPLQWRHNECDDVSNHRRLRCLLNCWYECRSKKTSKLRITALCVGNSPMTGEFPAQKTSYAESVSIWWRHHAIKGHCGIYVHPRKKASILKS